MNREKFIKSQASEKITMAHIKGVRRITHWTDEGGGLWSREVPRFVSGVNVAGSSLSVTTSVPLAGEYLFDHFTNKLTIHLVGGANPNENQVVVTFLLAFSTAPVTLSANLLNDGPQIPYPGRIKSAPGFSFKVGVEQDLVGQIGGGTLRLENTDRALDRDFNRYFFENQECTIYSWNRNLRFDEAQIIYRGLIESQRSDGDEVHFVLKDRLFSLVGTLPQDTFSSNDNVPDRVVGRFKRRLYGRVAGLRTQSISTIGTGLQISGTVAGDINTTTVTGSGTSFLSDVRPNDRIIIGIESYRVFSIQSDTELTTSSNLRSNFSGITPFIDPEIPVVTRNRTQLIAGHAISEPTKEFVQAITSRRMRLNNVVDLNPGDVLYFHELDIFRTIQVVNPDTNDVRLTQTIFEQQTPGSNITRLPVNSVHIEDQFVPRQHYTINNEPGKCEIIFNNDVEFELAETQNLARTLTFTNSSRVVTGSEGDKLDEILKPRDWVRVGAGGDWHEILSVEDDEIELATDFTGTSGSKSDVQYKNVKYLDDETPVIVDCYGATIDGTLNGKWLRTATEVMLDVLNLVGVSVDEADFSDAARFARQTVSMMLPLQRDGDITTAKEVVDLLAQSTFTAVTLNNDLKPSGAALRPVLKRDTPVLFDSDVISWSLRAVSGETFARAIVRYQPRDFGVAPALVRSNPFVENVIRSENTQERQLYLYFENDASIAAGRFLHRNSLARADVNVESDLRLEKYQVGDSVILDLKGLPARLGSDDARQGFIVVGKTVTGSRVKLQLTNLGQNFSRACHITESGSPEYDSATKDDKLYDGYITDDQGAVGDDPETTSLNLIS